MYGILLFLYLFLIQDVLCESRTNPIVETQLGSIRGLRASDGNYSMFMGIRYARVDRSNPFGAAIAEPPFEGIFDAYDDSAICPQIEEFNNTVTGSLDCLHLNIYVPDSASSSNRLPVLIWIYGGGFRIGFAGRYVYGPSYLVRHDIILVTINYRLGPYGFMCLDTPDIPGNQGFKDQFLALRWIKDNIDAFGGDPDQVTAFGESAGGIAVDFHLMSPHETLFNKVIVQSGTSLIPAFFEPVKDAPLRLAKYLGHETDDMNDAITFLASTDTNSVILAGEILSLSFRPCVEKEFNNVDRFITENWIFNNDVPKVRNVPVLIGFNDDEMLPFFALQTPEFFDTFDVFYEKLAIGFDADNEAFAGMEDIVRQFYIGDEPIDVNVRFKLCDFESDLKHNHPNFRSITRFLENDSGNIFFYVFSYVGERNFVKQRLNITIGGAAHADEIGYLFDMVLFDKTPNPEDQLVIDRMTTMWANFVKYGDPTPESSELLPIKWIPITKGSPDHYLEIGSELSAKTRPFTMRMSFWDLFYKTNRDLQIIYPGANNACRSVDIKAFAVFLVTIPIIILNHY